MEETTRKLASARLISALETIPNADKLELAIVDGWQCVVVKGKHTVGELIVYYEVDSFIPVLPEYEFLRKSCYKKADGLGEGFRIKTIRLRGQLSQGLVMQLTDVMPKSRAADVYEGEDLTAELGVKKYEKPEGAVLSGEAKGYYPEFLCKTDQERIQNVFGRLKQKFAGFRDELSKGLVFEKTLKLDGSSMQVFYNNGEMGVCSRNIHLKESDTNTFWKVAKSSQLHDKVVTYCELNGRNLSFQGELMGPNICGNREGLTEHKFFLFDIWDIDRRRFLTAYERTEIARQLEIEQVPFLGFCFLFDICDTVQDVLAMAEIESLNHEVAEGVVFKSVRYVDGQIVHFKAISNRYLCDFED